MKRIMKSFRLREDTVRELNKIKEYYDRWEPDLEITQTDLITWAIASMYYQMVECGDIAEEKEG